MGTTFAPFGWWGTAVPRCALRGGPPRAATCAGVAAVVIPVVIFVIIIISSRLQTVPETGASPRSRNGGDPTGAERAMLALPPTAAPRKLRGGTSGGGGGGARRARGAGQPGRGPAARRGTRWGTGVSAPGQLSPSSGRRPAEPPRRSMPRVGPWPHGRLEFVFLAFSVVPLPGALWGICRRYPSVRSLCRAAGRLNRRARLTNFTAAEGK